MSMIEVLAAMTLFAIAATGLAAFTATSLRFGADNRASGTAHMLAQRELEEQRGLEYEDIATRAYLTTQHGQEFEVSSDVEDDEPASGMKHVTVTVRWTGPLGLRSYGIETIFTSLN
jgi:Tfp pilus assembly protein PilV